MSIEMHVFCDEIEIIGHTDSSIDILPMVAGSLTISKSDVEAMAKHFGLIDGWVSVDERLPDPVFDFVIAYADGAMSTIGYSSDRGFYEVHPIKTQLVIEDITHWKPLPQPPKGTDK